MWKMCDLMPLLECVVNSCVSTDNKGIKDCGQKIPVHSDAGTDGTCQGMGTGGGERRCSPQQRQWFCTKGCLMQCPCCVSALRTARGSVGRWLWCVSGLCSGAPSPGCSSGIPPSRWFCCSRCHSSAQGPSLALLLPAELCLPFSALLFARHSSLLCFGVAAHPPHPLQ